MKNWFKTNLPHILAVLFFIVITFIYFSPVMEGKVLTQTDVQQANAMQHELLSYQKPDGTTPLWTNSMFGGMPAFQIGGHLYRSNIVSHIIDSYDSIFPNPTNLILLYLLGGYLLFSVLGFKPILAAAGAVAITFSSYNFIYIEAGHGNQAFAIAFFAPIVAGVLVTFRGRYLLGAAITAFFLSWEIRANHPQMAYYLALSLALLVVLELVLAIRSKTLVRFFTASLILIGTAAVAVAVNFSTLWVNYEFQEFSNRGKHELTLDKSPAKGGVTKEYAYAWSQGVGESTTFLIPGAYGGGETDVFDQNSEVAKGFTANNIPLDNLQRVSTYWGPKPFTSGPWYFGSIVLFLFVLGLIVVKNPLKWWLLAATVFSIMLSWGKHFQGFSDLFFDHIPLYNKFRAVESILVIASYTIPFLAFLAIREIAEIKQDQTKLWKNIKLAFYIVGGILAVMIAVPSLFFDFSSLQEASPQFPEWLKTAMHADRASILRKDAIRSLLFIALGLLILWAIVHKKIKQEYAYLALGLLIMVDLWGVDKRYLNNQQFVQKNQLDQAFTPRPVDVEILQDKSLDYRVYDASIDTYNSASSSYYHKTLGGYNAAKLQRYADIIEYQLDKRNMAVFNMLNTKYFIMPDSVKGAIVQQNPGALGNAWFVNSVRFVDNPDAEMNALTGLEPKEEAVVDRKFEKKDILNILKIDVDTSAHINLTDYQPDHLTYQYSSRASQVAIFSEIYYANGWNAYIDGKQAPYFRANYILRGMQLPAGTHKVEFIFQPRAYIVGEKISMAGSIILVLVLLSLIGAQVYAARQHKPELSAEEDYSVRGSHASEHKVNKGSIQDLSDHKKENPASSAPPRKPQISPTQPKKKGRK